jgi:molybdate transport system ATP-binding protein
VADPSLTVRLHQISPIPLAVEFACAKGDVVAIFGASGSGKTTILRSIAGLYRPSDAKVRAGAQVWTDTNRQLFEPPHRRRVGFVFQEYALFPHLTAAGNVMAALTDRPRPGRRARAEAILEQVHLSGRADRRPGQLSGGERQRVALARALAREPAVLLLDEPFAAVDRAVRRHLQNEIDQIRRTLDIPLVLVTHDLEDVVRLATDVLILEKGKSVAVGRLAAVMSRPDLGWLRRGAGLGSVIDAVAARIHGSRGLVEFTAGEQTILAAARGVSVGAAVRLRIPAREVILASGQPEGLSVHNTLAATVMALHADPAFDHVIVQLDIGGVVLLAEVTGDAVGRLGIEPGRHMYALVKSVSVEVAQMG